jgi:hypothetical protein
VSIELGGLEPGTFFNSPTIRLEANAPGLVARTLPTVLPWFFTFVEFRIDLLEEDYEMVVTRPYRVPGTYILMQGSQYILEPPLLAASMQIPVIPGQQPPSFSFPIPQPWGLDLATPPALRYQLLFLPAIQGIPSGFDRVNWTGNFAYSQVVQHVPDPERDSAISTPRNFDIVRTDNPTFREWAYRLLPTPGDMSGDEGLLSMTLRWDLGTVRTIENMLNTSDDGVLVLYYEVNKGTRPPEPGFSHPLDPSHFATVRMEITSSAGLRLAYTISYVDIDGLEHTTEPTEPHLLQASTPPGFQTARYTVRVNFEEMFAARRGHRDADYDAGRMHFRYPEVYFLNVRPVDDVGNSLPGSGVSDSDTLTLSDIGRLQVPSPQNMSIYNVTSEPDPITGFANRVSATADWVIPLDHLRDYLNSFYNMSDVTSLDEDIDIDIWMNLYITHDEPLIRIPS